MEEDPENNSFQAERNVRTAQIAFIGSGVLIIRVLLAIAVFIAYLFIIPAEISHSSPSIYVKQVTQNEKDFNK
jgi:hypothetical protein